ncbi:MAG: hypothetical protein ACHQU1_05960 [Gemmatimonadales bacterium]
MSALILEVAMRPNVREIVVSIALAVGLPAAGRSQVVQRVQVAPVMSGADVAASMATITLPALTGVMNGVSGGSVNAMLKNATIDPGSGNHIWIGPANGYVRVSSGAHGKYHVRLNFSMMGPPQPGSAVVSLHNGQLPGDSLVGQCTVTAATPRCDVVVYSPSSSWFLVALLDSGSPLYFVSATVAPTP